MRGGELLGVGLGGWVTGCLNCCCLNCDFMGFGRLSVMRGGELLGVGLGGWVTGCLNCCCLNCDFMGFGRLSVMRGAATFWGWDWGVG